MKIAFRADGTSQIGTGHIMRSIALSEELKNRGHSCFFLSKIDSEELINRVKQTSSFQKMETEATTKEDLDILLKFSKENNVDWIITDHYGINSDYVKILKENKFKVLSVDDTAQIHYYSDIVLNQNIGAEQLAFSAEKYTKFLLGPKYTMIRDELLRRDEKIENNKVKKILVTLGGTDNDNFTLKILKLLESVDKNAEILVVLGPFNLFYDAIRGYIKETGLKIKLIKSPENMAEVYLESDIAISAGGSSCYELAYFGIPNIIITIADNQLYIANELDKQKVSIYLGKKSEIKAEQLEDKIKELINNHSLRKNMSRNGKKLVDGKGKKGIVDFMESF